MEEKIMNYIDASLVTINDPEYHQTFWNHMKGQRVDTAYLAPGKAINGTQYLPNVSFNKYLTAKNECSLFHNVVNRMSVLHDHTIFAQDTDQIAEWIPEGQPISSFDGESGLSKNAVGYHKLATIIKFSEDFIFGEGFDIENNVIRAFARSVSRAEEQGIISGDGVNMPFGILHPERGAEVGVSTEKLTYDDVIKLFFSVKAEYRKNGKWLMNDETALKLRSLKDADGNYLWNQESNTILGKEVLISEFMSDDDTPIVFGDFSYYWVIDRTNFACRILNEVFAEKGLIGYLGAEYLDGMLIRREALKMLKIME
jgi:HK97 family phage major capsid protein